MYRKLATLVVALTLLFTAMPSQTFAYAFTGGYYSQAEIGNYRLSVCFEQGYAYNNRVVIEHGLERAQQGINNLDWVSFGYLVTGLSTFCSSNGAYPNLYIWVDDFNPFGNGCDPNTTGWAYAYTDPIGVNAYSTSIHINQDCFSTGQFYLGDSPPVPYLKDLESLMAHEGLHALGLDHAGSGFAASAGGPHSPSNCNYNIGWKIATIAQDDENGLHARYPYLALGDTSLSTYAVCAD